MEKITDDLNFISSLPDQPSMPTQELKRQFDMAGNIIKSYINDIQIPEIEQFREDLEEDVSTRIENLSTEITNRVNTAIAGVESEMSTLQTSVNDSIEELNTKVAGTLKYYDFLITSANFGASVHGGNRGGATSTANNAGYFPIGIVGWNRTGDNGQPRIASVEGLYLTSRSVGSATIYCSVKGTSQEAIMMGASGTVDILWAKV